MQFGKESLALFASGMISRNSIVIQRAMPGDLSIDNRCPHETKRRPAVRVMIPHCLLQILMQSLSQTHSLIPLSGLLKLAGGMLAASGQLLA